MIWPPLSKFKINFRYLPILTAQAKIYWDMGNILKSSQRSEDAIKIKPRMARINADERAVDFFQGLEIPEAIISKDWNFPWRG